MPIRRHDYELLTVENSNRKRFQKDGVKCIEVCEDLAGLVWCACMLVMVELDSWYCRLRDNIRELSEYSDDCDKRFLFWTCLR